ncbi:MAG: helicase HerA domain-containing protein [Gammaproteobacteria bacterium]
MNNHEHIALGIRHGYGEDTPFSFTLADRRHHTHVIGKTGTGKSTLLLNTICEAIRAGRGVGVIDPHGPLAKEVLDCIPKSRTEDVVYFDPSDAEYPISLTCRASGAQAFGGLWDRCGTQGHMARVLGAADGIYSLCLGRNAHGVRKHLTHRHLAAPSLIPSIEGGR